MDESMKLRIVVFKEEEMFVAQCLEHDICTQAATIEALQDRMNCLIKAELEAGQEIAPAPKRFHEMWDSAFYRPSGNYQYGLMAA